MSIYNNTGGYRGNVPPPGPKRPKLFGPGGTKPLRSKWAEKWEDPNMPVMDWFKGRQDDQIDDRLEDLKGYADDEYKNAQWMLNDARNMGGMMQQLRGDERNQELYDLAKGMNEGYGQQAEDYFRDIEGNKGVMGKDYSPYEQQMLKQLGNVGQNLGGDVKNIMGQIGVDKSKGGQLVDQQLIKAMQGELLDPDSQWLEAQQAVYEDMMDDAMQGVKEEMGAQRGIGGGRMMEMQHDVGQDMANQMMAHLTDIQKSYADVAPQYFQGERGQDIDQLGIGAELAGKQGDLRLGGAGQMADYLLGAGGLGLEQQKFKADEDARKYGMEKDKFDMLKGMYEGDRQFGQDERFKRGEFGQGLQNDAWQRQMDMLGAMLEDKGLDINDPGAMEKILGGLGDIFGAGAAQNFPAISKLLGLG